MDIDAYCLERELKQKKSDSYCIHRFDHVIKQLVHPSAVRTVKTRDQEPAFRQVSLNRFLHKW